MTLPDRNNPYSFNEFLEWRKNVNYYIDDPFIKRALKVFAGDSFNEADREAREISPKVSYRWRDMAEAIAVPEKRPYIMHYDGHHNRIDRIVRPRETEIMEKEIFSEGLFVNTKSPWVKLIKMFLIYQNGEACIACPVTCTEGLVKLLEIYQSEETRYILQHCRDGIDGDFAIGAQYLSEIHGGSDVPANLLEAVNENGTWRLYGSKFFCSATHADYVVITAKPRGSEEVALFVMPSWLPGNKEKEIRNDYTIDRIKWKMGTSELTTGELTFNGAIAYPIGPLNRGVSNVVSIVLTYSRLTVGLSAAAFMTRACREAKAYGEFRYAFGRKISDFSLVKAQLQEIENYTKRTIAGAFNLYKDFLEIENKRHLKKDSLSMEENKKIFRVRELIMLQKITASLDSTDVIRNSMSIFGGHGVMEDFSSLPRLYRDSAINELWEGPRNVLLTQIHRDLQKNSSWYKPDDLISDILHGKDKNLIREFSSELEYLLGIRDLTNISDDNIKIAGRWDDFTKRLFHEYQEKALSYIEQKTNKKLSYKSKSP